MILKCEDCLNDVCKSTAEKGAKGTTVCFVGQRFCKQCNKEIVRNGKFWEHKYGSPRHIAEPGDGKRCKKCGNVKISACIMIIGFPDHHVNGSEIKYCGSCDDAPSLELKSPTGATRLHS